MDFLFEERLFLDFLRVEKGLAENSLAAYRRDLDKFRQFLIEQGWEISSLNALQIDKYQEFMRKCGLADASINRNLSTLRTFFKYLSREKEIRNPMGEVAKSRPARRLPKALTVSEVLSLIDILIVSSDFPGRFLGISDARTALSELRSRFGCCLVGMTLGATGSLMLADGETFIESPGFDVPNGCKDTTGAGDAFRAGLLYGLLSGEAVGESARMANAVAALKCREIGARTALPTRDELARFLRNI